MSDSTEITGQNVLLIEEHPALRKGLELLLGNAGFSVVGAAGSVQRGVQLFERRRPDVVVVDYALGGDFGTELIDRILAIDPEAKVLVYTATTGHEAFAAIRRSGARGLALKDSDSATLIDAIRTVAGGGRFMDPRAIVAPAGGVAPRLTRRQGEILSLLADGLTGEQTAERLVLSPETVRTHIRNAMDRLDAHTRVHAVSRAARLQEITL